MTGNYISSTLRVLDKINRVTYQYKESIEGQSVDLNKEQSLELNCKEDHILGMILKKLELSNIFVLANTSFNISSDPMVYSKEDAYLGIERMNIKYLLTENGIYKKKIN